MARSGSRVRGGVGGSHMRRMLVTAWWRLFLFQAAWNYDRMVGVGMAYALEPLLAALPGGRAGERYRAAMQRSALYFNAHPYLGAMAVGAQARAEHDGLPGEAIERMRRALVGPLGSLGDQIVWVGLLPAVLGLGLAVGVAAGPLAGVVVFLILYNAGHLVLRSWALRAGWRFGKQVAQAISGRGLQRALRFVGPAAAVAVGLAIPLAAQALLQDFEFQARAGAAAVALAAFLLQRWAMPALGGLRFGLIVAGLAGLVGWLWH